MKVYPIQRVLNPLSALATVLLYFAVRLGWPKSVMFSYDMPRLAFVIQDFLAQGTFLSSQRFVLETPWGNPAWGPALISFYAPFLALSSHPLTVSLLLTIFNVLSVIALISIGWRYFSPEVGLIAGLLLALNPYWVIFSRLIYQPTPVITFLSLSMLLFFLTLAKPKSFWLSLLILSWGILFQLYLHTSSFIAPGLILLASRLKKLGRRPLLVGFILAGVLFLPSLRFYLDQPRYLGSFFRAPGRFTPPEKSFGERFTRVTEAYFKTISGGNFSWYLGYAQPEFQNRLPGRIMPEAALAKLAILITGLYLLISLRSASDAKLRRLILLAWALGPLWFLSLFWATDLTPRYFLTAIPPFLLIVAIFFADLHRLLLPKLKTRAGAVWIFPCLLGLYWSVFSINFHQFVSDYSYPQGRLGDVAETPYLDLENAIKWTIADADRQGFQGLILSNDPNHPYQSAQWIETRYLWQYVFHRQVETDYSNRTGYYLIQLSHVLNEAYLKNYVRFGPFVVSETKQPMPWQGG